MPGLSSDAWRTLSPYLDLALGMTDEKRAVWVSSLRMQDPALARVLETLLFDHSVLNEEGFLDNCAVELPAAPSLIGQIVGAYKLTSQIGQGGTSSVWLAERNDDPIQRGVAVKLLNVALLGKASERRFRREAGILSLLVHPHIAELIDAGVSRIGQPYLVLEYVKGDHIDCFCDRRRLDIPARIRLFLDVLAAVAHAHANLILHRDLKPSNVLVSNQNRVKLLDFGIALLLQDERHVEEGSLLATEGERAMTPAYAAPEQLRGESVTTATDVYALGVMLHVLLTGQHPHGNKQHPPTAIIKAVMDVDPVRPSELLHCWRDCTAATRAASRRATTSNGLRQLLFGDLDAIVAKTLKKHPAERYVSVSALAKDLRRYLKKVTAEYVPRLPENSSALQVTGLLETGRSSKASAFVTPDNE